MNASRMSRFSLSHAALLAVLAAAVLAIAACGDDGGDGGNGEAPGPIIVEPAAGDVGDGPNVVGAVPTLEGVPTVTPTPVRDATPTPTPPSRTTDEEGTGRLVDELSSDEFPRTSARVIECEFRNEPATAQQKIGKSFVVQGDVLDAGKDASGQPFVHFKAGAGRVTCFFEDITDAELLRFTPDGTNAIVGTIDAWDADNRVLTIRDCRVVLGF